MKKIEMPFLGVGILLSLLPIYKVVTWFVVRYKKPNLNQAEKFTIQSEEMFPSFLQFESRYTLSLITLIVGEVSIGLLITSLFNANKKSVTQEQQIFVKAS